MTVEPLYRFLDLRAASGVSGLGRSTLRARIRSGDLPAVRLRNGRKLFVRAIDLQKLMVPVQPKPEVGE